MSIYNVMQKSSLVCQSFGYPINTARLEPHGFGTYHTTTKKGEPHVWFSSLKPNDTGAMLLLEPVRTYKGHSDYIKGLDFRVQGKTTELVTLAADLSLKLWTY